MRPPEGSQIGERLILEGNPAGEIPQTFQEILNPKKKQAEKLLPLLKANNLGEGTFNGVKLVTSKGVIKCATLKDCGISWLVN